jgi:DNA primase catalytic core
MQVSREGIERIRQANPIESVVAERGIGLKRKGKSLQALCPFHQEKTPSFSVSAEKGLYKCFGCGASGDVIGFVVKHDRLSFPAALELLARRAGLDLAKLMEERPRPLVKTPLRALTPPPPLADEADTAAARAVLSRVVEHYHRTFCERKDAQEYLAKRGLTDSDLLRALRVGYADGSLLKVVPRSGEMRERLLALGVVTAEGRELMGGCVVVPIPDPVTGQWVNLYGRGLRVARHCYLPGPLRGVLNFQAARTSEEVVLAESILDALSFHQAGICTAIPIYGTNGFTPDHIDTLKREGVKRVILALDNDDPGRKATDSLKEKLGAAGIAVRVASFPAGIKDANELLVSCNGDAGEAMRRIFDEAEPRESPARLDPAGPAAGPLPAASLSGSAAPAVSAASVAGGDGQLTLSRNGLAYRARVYPALLGRLRATVRVENGSALHVDTLDLYASRSRAEFARRAAKALPADASAVESDLLALLVEAEKTATEEDRTADVSPVEPMSEGERAEALAFLKREDLLDQVARDYCSGNCD